MVLVFVGGLPLDNMIGRNYIQSKVIAGDKCVIEFFYVKFKSLHIVIGMMQINFILYFHYFYRIAYRRIEFDRTEENIVTIE